MRFLWTDFAVGQVGSYGLGAALSGLRVSLEDLLAPFTPDPQDARRAMTTDADGYVLHAIVVVVERGLPAASSFALSEDERWQPPREVAVIYQKLSAEDRTLNRYEVSKHPEAVGVVRAVLLAEDLFPNTRTRTTSAA